MHPFLDLAGTLLNNAPEIAPFIKDTLLWLSKSDTLYTAGKERTMLTAQTIVAERDFDLLQI